MSCGADGLLGPDVARVALELLVERQELGRRRGPCAMAPTAVSARTGRHERVDRGHEGGVDARARKAV